MKTKKTAIWQTLLIITLLFTLSACENGGYAKGEQTNVFLSDLEGTFEGSYTSVVGSYIRRFETLPTFPGYEANVEITISIESGTMKVAITQPDETVISEIVTPNNPITLSGLSIIESGVEFYYIPIIFEAIGEEEVTGIQYTFSYKAP